MGVVNICDYRESSTFKNRASLSFVTCPRTTQNNVFSRWTRCVASAKFVGDMHKVVSRDYLSVKLWDLRAASNTTSMATDPVFSAQVTDYMERNLAVLVDQDCVSDSFFVDVSPDGKHIATGGYNKQGHVIDMNATTNTTITCNFGARRDAQVGKLKNYEGKQRKHVISHSGSDLSSLSSRVDYKKKV